MDHGIRNPVLRILVYGHIWLALGAAAQTAWMQEFLGGEGWGALMLAFCGTIVGYTFMRWARMDHPELGTVPHLAWFRANRKPLLYFALFCLGCGSAIAWAHAELLVMFLWPAAVITLFYVMPPALVGGRTIGLRRVPLLKALLIAFVWSMVTIGLPMAMNGMDQGADRSGWLFAMQFTFFLALAITFDLRDRAIDPPGLHTIPQVMGSRSAKALAVVLLLGVCVVGVLTLLGNRVESVVGTPNAPTAAGGAGGIVPNNSPLTGGAVLLDDNFENAAASGLGTEEDDSSRYAYEDGAYVIEVKEAEKIVWAQVDGTYTNARFAVDTEIPPGADVAAAGLIFHYQDADNFYLFSVSNDGYYALEVLEGNEWTVLIDWTQSDAVDAVRNRMRVETKGDSITLYVNDELLETTSDGTFTQGEAALAVSSLKESTAEVRFDNLLIELNE